MVKGELFAEVVKEWSWFNKTFTLDVPGPNDYLITGSFWRHEFTFERKGKKVATISKNFWGWSDSYGVEINDGEDDVMILCACIVIDQVLHDEKKDKWTADGSPFVAHSLSSQFCWRAFFYSGN